MSDRFAQNRESRKHKVERPRKGGQARREVVQSQVAVVQYTTNLAVEAGASRSQEPRPQVHANSWMQRGSPVTRELGSQGTSSQQMQKRTGFLETSE